MICSECLPPIAWWEPWDTSPFVPLRAYGNWPDWLITVWFVIAATVLTLYVFIAVKVWLVRRKSAALAAKDPTFPRWAFTWIAAFFIACGIAHALKPSAFFWPAYVFYIEWEVFTTAVSAAGAVGVDRLVRWVVKRLDVLTAERDAAVARLDRELAAKRQERARIQNQIAAAHAELRLVTFQVKNGEDANALHARIDAIGAGLTPAGDAQ